MKDLFPDLPPFRIVYKGLNELQSDQGESKPTPIYAVETLCMFCDRPIEESRYKHLLNEFCSRQCNRNYRTSCGYRTEADEVVEVQDAHASGSEVQPKKTKKRKPKRKGQLGVSETL